MFKKKTIAIVALSVLALLNAIGAHKVTDMMQEGFSVRPRISEKRLFETYPADEDEKGIVLAYTDEDGSRRIVNFTDDEKQRLRRVLAHMYDKSNQWTKVLEKISLAKKSIEELQSSNLDSEIQEFLSKMAQNEIEQNESLSHEFENTMTILFAMLIKDSYNLDQDDRISIAEFLSLGSPAKFLDAIQSKSTNEVVSFSTLYTMCSAPSSTSAFFTTSLKLDDIWQPIFSFSSKDLKPLTLSQYLENQLPSMFN